MRYGWPVTEKSRIHRSLHIWEGGKRRRKGQLQVSYYSSAVIQKTNEPARRYSAQLPSVLQKGLPSAQLILFVAFPNAPPRDQETYIHLVLIKCHPLCLRGLGRWLQGYPVFLEILSWRTPFVYWVMCGSCRLVWGYSEGCFLHWKHLETLPYSTKNAVCVTDGRAQGFKGQPLAGRGFWGSS